jgi:mannose-1-phosphate guanylyltransferase
MLQEAFERIAPIIPPEKVFVLTGDKYAQIARDQLPAVPSENVIGEPVGRGTAPPIGLAAMLLRKRTSPKAVMAVLTADHVISMRERFRQVLLQAARIAERGHLVTLGISATRPDTGYGYIERGEMLYEERFPVYRVMRFTEKPDQATAERFLASGRYSWNSGMFIWRVDSILAEIARQMPDLYDGLREIVEAWDTQARDEVFARVWPALPNETIDFGVMEHARDVVVIPVEIGWSDVGSWNALWEISPHDAEGNVTRGRNIVIDVHRSLIHSNGRLVAVVGLDDLVIVDTDDALLVSSRERSQEVKKIVRELKDRGWTEYL